MEKIEICGVNPSVLSSSEGKCVCVQKVKRKLSPSHQLVTVNTQAENECVVHVFDIEYKDRECMAFCFEVGDKAVFPCTDGQDVTFTELSSKQEVTKVLNKTFLFQWGKAGSKDWRSLKSVAEPNMYLFFEHNDNKVTIKPVELPLFRIQKKVSVSTPTPKLARFWFPNKLDRKTPYERVFSKHGPSFCEATAISTKSAYRHKRKPTKMRHSLKA